MSSNEKIKSLFSWCIIQTKGYNNVSIKNFTTSWRNGLGFCAILHRYGPELIDYDNLIADNVFENCQIAFQVGEKHFGIPALLDAKEMLALKIPDRLSVITYLTQCYATLTLMIPRVLNITDGPFSSAENFSNEIFEDKILETPDSDPPQEQRDQLTCEICFEVIYFLERLLVNDKFYHRSCYRQTQLSNLKMRNATLERPKNNNPDEINKSQIESDVIDKRARSRSRSLENDLSQKESNNSSFVNVNVAHTSPDDLSRPDQPGSSSHDLQKSIPIEDKTDELDVDKRILSSRSLSFECKKTPSLNRQLDKMSLENSASQSLNQLSADRSSLSASSMNCISINASSTDSLSKSLLVVCDTGKGEVAKLSGNLRSTSLNTSTSSLNSSSNKKRQAPLPPVLSSLAVKPSVVPVKTTARLKAVSKPEPIYPEDLNPFAVVEEENSKVNDTNPFAEYMTEKTCDDGRAQEKPVVKPRKRIAPKVPLKASISTKTNDEVMLPHSTNDLHSSLHGDDAQVSEQDLSHSLPGLPIPPSTTMDESSELSHPSEVSALTVVTTSETEDPINGIDLSMKDPDSPKENSQVTSTLESVLPTIVTQTEISSIEIENTVKDPEPDKRTEQLTEEAKSNGGLNLLIDSQGGRHKPPAPSRPLPQKREVRGDTSHEFIPYDSLYLELEEVNRTQSDMEIKGRAIQNSLNEVNEKDERYESLLEEWLEIVEKKNTMYVREHHLHEILRRQELEDRHSDLEYELRVLMGKQESLKTATEKAREDELIHQILDIVNARAQLTEDDVEAPAKSSTHEVSKKKTTLRKMFSTKHRSSSLGKNLLPFKIPKNAEKNKNKTPAVTKS